MADGKLIDSQWVDIVLPAAPADITVLFIALFILCAIIAAAILYFIYNQRPDRRARRNLKKLQNNGLVSENNSRELAFFIAENLRIAFHVTRLDKVCLENDKIKAWETYRCQLLDSCYGKVSPDPERIQGLITSAMFWLKQGKPVRSEGQR